MFNSQGLCLNYMKTEEKRIFNMSKENRRNNNKNNNKNVSKEEEKMTILLSKNE